MKFLERFWTGCGHCGGSEGCRIAEELNAAPHAPRPKGLGLVGSVLVVFILPLVTTIVGAWLAGRRFVANGMFADDLGQLAGALGGMVIGVVLAKAIVTIATRCRSHCAGDAE